MRSRFIPALVLVCGAVFLCRPPQVALGGPGTAADVERATAELTAVKRWLYFPIRTSFAPVPNALRRTVKVSCEGKVVRVISAELADQSPGWWSPLDIRAWKGRKLVVQVDRLPAGSKALELLHQSDAWENAEQLYHEPLRPQFHFSARRGWLNDPNAFFYYEGEYHLFFQHDPFCWDGAVKHWGHAVSRDLLHWKELDEAIYADEQGACWSGSGVVDWKNTSGLGCDGRPPLALAYTRAGNPFTQCLAFSSDGREFLNYPHNPVVPNIISGNRDPKLLWHEPSQRWVMAVYLGLPSDRKADGSVSYTNIVQFLNSPNLRDWKFQGVVEGFCECPDLFEIPLDGDLANRKWIVMGANGTYAVGSFNGKHFLPETDLIASRQNATYYASQTFNRIPHQDGRCIQMIWFRIPMPGMCFNQAMSVPLELTLHATPQGPRLRSLPAAELDTLRAGALLTIKDRPLAAGDDPLAGMEGRLLDVKLDADCRSSAGVELTIQGVPIRYDARRHVLSCLGQEAYADSPDGHVRLRALADVGSLEIFAQQGAVVIPAALPADRPNPTKLGLRSLGGQPRIVSLEAWRLKSIWDAQSK